MNKNIMALFLLFLLTPLVYAEEYYADVEITVDNSGFVTINGITNHPDLLINNTELYTSKKQSYWLLNITKEDIFSDFVYTVALPIDSSINYIKTSGSMRIEDEQGKLTISGFGQNKSFYITVQYQVGKSTNAIQTIDFSLFLTIITISLFIILIVSYFVYKSLWRKEENKNIINNTNENKTEFSFKGLSDRQREIMDLLIQKNRPISQTAIQNELNIPKAAVSRNISSLELKGLIEKEKIGMSNLIRLKKP